MRASLVAIWLFAVPALAGAPAKILVAPAGACAGEEPEIAKRVLAELEPGADMLAQAPSSVVHLTPANVASAAPLAATSAPSLPEFAGPEACDNPGSGCITEKLLEDPDPGTGCGFPGSPCP